MALSYEKLSKIGLCTSCNSLFGPCIQRSNKEDVVKFDARKRHRPKRSLAYEITWPVVEDLR